MEPLRIGIIIMAILSVCVYSPPLVWNFRILLRKYLRWIVCEEVVLVHQMGYTRHEGLVVSFRTKRNIYVK